MRHILALLLLAGGLTGTPALAELSAQYRSLLEEADRHQDDTAFRETALLVARVAPGGRDEVMAAILEIAPNRHALFSDWTDAGTAPPPSGTVAIVDAPEEGAALVLPVQARSSPTPATTTAAAAAPIADVDIGSRWNRLQRYISPDLWDGSIKFGLRLDRGNVDQSDYRFALELDREFPAGWTLDSKIEYLFTETSGRTTRDTWQIDARGERQNVDGLGYYVGGSVEDNRMAGYDYAAHLTAGGLYEPVDTEGMNWVLRGGAGARHRAAAEAEDELIFELGSVFAMALTETSRFKSETTVLAGAASRGDQRFSLDTDLMGEWGVELGLRFKHEFEPAPQRLATDTRLEVALARRF